MQQTVIITGGARGIGYATAEAFLARRARVAFCSPHSRRVTDAETRLRAAGEVMGYVADVRDPEAVRAFVQATLDRFDTIDVLVNNAGVASSGDFVDQDLSAIDAQIDVNLKGMMYATRAVLPTMLPFGRGVIVNVASGAGKTGFPGLAAYCASKFGVVGFTQAVADEVASDGVRVYAVCPGGVATDMLRGLMGTTAGGIAPERVAAQIARLSERAPIAPGECLQQF